MSLGVVTVMETFKQNFFAKAECFISGFFVD